MRTGAKAALKWALRGGARQLGRYWPWPPHALILTYHAVEDLPGPYSIRPEELRRQVELLEERGFQFLTVRELGEALEAGALGSRTACLTFDDALQSIEEPVLWLLGRGVRPTIFAMTEAPVLASLARASRLALPTLIELRRSGVEIGSHSCTHPRLPRLPAARLVEELAGSRRKLEDGLQSDVLSLAYPHGAYGRREVLAASRAGYRFACTTDLGYPAAGSHPLLLPRVAPASVEELAELVDGRVGLYVWAAGLLHAAVDRARLLGSGA